MKALLLLLASLTFDVGLTTVATNPAAAAATATAVAQNVDPCCPEWLCRILCGWVCQPPGQGCCQTQGCCGTSCCR
jgi:hypothetical protein